MVGGSPEVYLASRHFKGYWRFRTFRARAQVVIGTCQNCICHLQFQADQGIKDLRVRAEVMAKGSLACGIG